MNAAHAHRLGPDQAAPRKTTARRGATDRLRTQLARGLGALRLAIADSGSTDGATVAGALAKVLPFPAPAAMGPAPAFAPRAGSDAGACTFVRRLVAGAEAAGATLAWLRRGGRASSRLAPGAVVMGAALEIAIDTGFDLVAFGRGHIDRAELQRRVVSAVTTAATGAVLVVALAQAAAFLPPGLNLIVIVVGGLVIAALVERVDFG